MASRRNAHLFHDVNNPVVEAQEIANFSHCNAMTEVPTFIRAAAALTGVELRSAIKWTYLISYHTKICWNFRILLEVIYVLLWYTMTFLPRVPVPDLHEIDKVGIR